MAEGGMSTEQGRILLKNLADRLEGIEVLIDGKPARVNPDIIKAIRRAAEGDKAAIVSQFTTDLKAIEAKIAAAAERLSAGYEMREVPCEVRWDYKKDRKTVIRKDTREIIRDEKIPDSERQMEVPLPGKSSEEIITEAKTAVENAQKEIEKRSLVIKAPLTPEERAGVLANGHAEGVNPL